MTQITKKNLMLHKPDINKIKTPGYKLLVKVDQSENEAEHREEQDGAVKLESGLLLMKNTNDQEAWIEKQKALMQNSGIIISIGNTCWKQFDDGKAWAKVGDRVYFKRYSGRDIEASDGKIYKILTDIDIDLIEVNDE